MNYALASIRLSDGKSNCFMIKKHLSHQCIADTNLINNFITESPKCVTWATKLVVSADHSRPGRSKITAPISIVVTFICIASFINSMNYPRTIYFNDYINPLLDENKLHSHHAFVLGIRNTLDKLRKHILYSGSVKIHRNPASSNVMYLIILMIGEIALNWGPNRIYPCGYCVIPVTWERQRVVCCDNCNIWYNSTCFEYSSNKLELLQRSNVSCTCCTCDSQNIDSFTFHSFDFEISNLLVYYQQGVPLLYNLLIRRSLLVHIVAQNHT